MTKFNRGWGVRGKLSVNDMVYDKNQNPIWCNSPEATKEWLNLRVEKDPRMWEYFVRRGSTNRYVTVQQYLRRKKT